MSIVYVKGLLRDQGFHGRLDSLENLATAAFSSMPLRKS